MNSVTLQGGPGDGEVVQVSDDTTRHGTYYYVKRLTVPEIASTYRYERKGEKTHTYKIKRHVGVYKP